MAWPPWMVKFSFHRQLTWCAACREPPCEPSFIRSSSFSTCRVCSCWNRDWVLCELTPNLLSILSQRGSWNDPRIPTVRGMTSTAHPGGSRFSIRSCSWIFKASVVSYQSCRQSCARVSSGRSTCQLPQETAYASGRSRERSCSCSFSSLSLAVTESGSSRSSINLFDMYRSSGTGIARRLWTAISMWNYHLPTLSAWNAHNITAASAWWPTMRASFNEWNQHCM